MTSTGMVPASSRASRPRPAPSSPKRCRKGRRVDVEVVGVHVEVDQLHPVAGRAQDLAGAGGELAEVPGPERRQHDADRPRPATGQRARQPGGGEVQPVGSLDDPLPGARADAGDPAQRARHRAFVDPGLPGDIGNRGATGRACRRVAMTQFCAPRHPRIIRFTCPFASSVAGEECRPGGAGGVWRRHARRGPTGGPSQRGVRGTA